MGGTSSKKKNRTKAPSGKRPPKGSGPLLFRSDPVTLFEDSAIGLLFFSLALVLSTQNGVSFTLPKLVALRIGTLVLFCLVGIHLWKGQIRSVPRPILLAGTCLGLWWIFSTFFALHKPTALSGYFGRYNGLWTHEICLILFFIMATMRVDISRVRRILLLFIAALIPVALYAVVQYFQFDPLPWSTRWERSVSTVGHGVPLAALLGMAIPFILVFLFEADRALEKTGWWITLLIFIWAMASTLSRGPWIGTFIASMVMVIVRFKGRTLTRQPAKDQTPSNSSPPFYKRWGRPGRFLFIFLFLATVLGGFFLTSTGGHRITDRFQTFIDLKGDTSFRGRLLYYQAALKGIKDHPLVGIGFENFRNIYPRYRLAEDNQIFEDTIPTMVHNGYLQTALENGIPGLALYLTLIILVLIQLTKAYLRNKGLIPLALLAALGGFLIQDLSGWPDIALTPFFWIFLGLALSLSLGDRPTIGVSGTGKGKGSFFLAALLLVGILFLATLTLDGLRMFWGDRLFGTARSLSLEQDWPVLESRVLRGLEWLPGESNYKDTAGLYYLKRFSLTRDQGTYRKAAKILEEGHQDNPFDPYPLIHRIDLEQMALGAGVMAEPSAYVQKAVVRLIKIDRNNRTIYRAVARLKIREKKYADALILLEAGNWLCPGAPNPRDEWVAAQQGLFLDFVRGRQFDRALKVLQEVVAQYPDEESTYTQMGNLFGAMKDYKKAREAFLTALKLNENNPNAQNGLKELEKIAR